jgi:orotidine-5'-phosphate decarboxylase
MTRQELFNTIKRKGSFLCVGLDTDPKLIPSHLLNTEDPVFEFNRAIIDATIDYAVAFKPNTAFYEAQGLAGWESLLKTVKYLREKAGDCLLIADAKRGDIGNTSTRYAHAFFHEMDFDAVTVAPYMGRDSVEPFLSFEGRWTILLALTSNQGSADFQTSESASPLFEQVIRRSATWGSPDNMMYVIGATRAQMLSRVRELIPDHFLLVPGVGAQGGDLAEVSRYGLNEQVGLLVNSSRAILYASGNIDFAEAARTEAARVQSEMEAILKARGII